MDTPTNEQLEKTRLEIQSAADTFLTPGNGGIALWVWASDLKPRSAIRLNGVMNGDPMSDLSVMVCNLAALHVALENITQQMLVGMGVRPEDVNGVVAKGVDVIRAKAPFSIAYDNAKPNDPTARHVIKHAGGAGK